MKLGTLLSLCFLATCCVCLFASPHVGGYFPECVARCSVHHSAWRPGLPPTLRIATARHTSTSHKQRGRVATRARHRVCRLCHTLFAPVGPLAREDSTAHTWALTCLRHGGADVQFRARGRRRSPPGMEDIVSNDTAPSRLGPPRVAAAGPGPTPDGLRPDRVNEPTRGPWPSVID